jgi:hypothetical protein
LADTNTQTLQTSEPLVKTDFTLLAIQARALAGLLYKHCIDGKMAYEPYLDFVQIFYQLYLYFKPNAEDTNKIDDWEEKEKFYDKLFYYDLIVGIDVKTTDGKVVKSKLFPFRLIRIFDSFVSDMKKCGIYDISAGEFHGKRGI